jgi:hypothetical protein
VAPPNDPQAQEAIDTLNSGKGITTGSETHEKLMQQVLAISKEYFK